MTAIDDWFGSEGRVFPLGFGGRVLLWMLAIALGHGLYVLVSWAFFDAYRDAFAKANVLGDVLAGYPNSPQLGSVLGESATAENSIAKMAKRMTPADLKTLIVAAGISEAEDIKKPTDILDLKGGGVGAWVATGILSTEVIQSHSLEKVWLSGKVECDKNVVPVSSVDGLFFLYKTLGNAENGSKEALCSEDGSKQIKEEAAKFVRNVTGERPSVWSVSAPESRMEVYGAIKRAMSFPWAFFNVAPGNRTLTAKEYLDSPGASNGEEGPYRDSNRCDGEPCIMPTTDLSWFKEDPTEKEAALVKLSTLLVEAIQASEKVRTNRFLYQAWRGWIQWIIIVIFFYVFLQILWRVAAGVRKVEQPRKKALFGPLVTIGKVVNWDDAVFQSRRFVDMWINTLPLLGLLGTVVGILFGLPNASAAINAKGPTAAASVNQLFEQLGLAFGTTALAVMAVVALQVIWETRQYYEDRFVANVISGTVKLKK